MSNLVKAVWDKTDGAAS